MIVVTGASRGLGKAICERLTEKGHEVFGLARNVSALPFAAALCDVSDPAQVQSVVKGLKKQKCAIFALINAAGIAAMNLALTTPPEVSQRVITTNLLGTIYCCQGFTPLMIRNGRGRVINFSSIAVALALQGESGYVAAKAGIEGFSRVFARELSAFGITVNCIAPGPVNTDLLKGISDEQIRRIVAEQIIDRRFTPDTVCDVVELLLDDRSASLSGQVWHIGGV